MISKYFFPFCELPFHFSKVSFATEVCNFNEVQFLYFSFCWLHFGKQNAQIPVECFHFGAWDMMVLLAPFPGQCLGNSQLAPWPLRLLCGWSVSGPTCPLGPRSIVPGSMILLGAHEGCYFVIRRIKKNFRSKKCFNMIVTLIHSCLYQCSCKI